MPSANRTRFEPTRFSTVWQNIVAHLTPPSHPSTTSQSAIESAFDHTENGHTESHSTSTRPLEQLLNPKHGTEGRHKQQGVRRKFAKSSQGNTASRYGDDEDNRQPHEPVSHVVVDADFDHFTPMTAKSDSGSTTQTHSLNAFGARNGKASKGNDLLGPKAEGEDGGNESVQGDSNELQSIRRDRRETWLARTVAYEWIIERLWPNIKHFMDSSFPEARKEHSFQKEAWFGQKQGALVSAAFFLISWTLTAALQPKVRTSKYVQWAYLGLAGSFTVPICVLVLFDIPRRYPWIWQPWLLGATWVVADLQIIEMYRCDFFSPNPHCGGKNFLNALGFGIAQPTLALLALRQNRLFAALGAGQWLILAGVLLIGEGSTPTLFYRNFVNFALFHSFLIGTSFLKERSDRQMFALRQQLKIQYRATQSAQVMERRASDSKRRFVSYIFHEVRVPLNTALLAVQNLEGEHVFKGLHDDQEEMAHGLMGSLTMMEKVLNDVLSFNRMESGKFSQARKPFDFHKSIQLVALSHRMQAQMAGIELIVDLDRDIDKIGGSFIGDEMRLRQVASNLVSNSIKFTESGSVQIITKLLYPRLEPTPGMEIDDPLRQAAMNLQKLQRVEEEEKLELSPLNDIEKGSVHVEKQRRLLDTIKEKEEETRSRKVVVRIEIHDTGVGLKRRDVIDNRLFSPYVQTEIGRRQGGKGSGLGLALVRQIVKLSNGRLGVESEFGKGSMFWFELPYTIPPPPKTRTTTLTQDSPDIITSTTLQPPPNPLVRGMPRMERNMPVRPEMATTESTMPLITRVPSISASQDETASRKYARDIRLEEGETPSDVTLIESSPGLSDKDLLFEGSEKPSPGRSVPTPSSAVIPPVDPPLCTLVVDDDKLTRMLMSRMLKRLGHQVTTAENGKIALEMIKDSFERQPGSLPFDIVFLDNQMPMMSGVEVAREVREMGCPLYIVGCTGNALREDQDEYIAAGADGIIPKPIHQNSVIDSIREARRRVAGETVPKDIQPDYGGNSPMGEATGLRF